MAWGCGGVASGSSLVLCKGGWGVSTEECGWLRGRADCLALLSSTSQMFVCVFSLSSLLLTWAFWRCIRLFWTDLQMTAAEEGLIFLDRKSQSCSYMFQRICFPPLTMQHSPPNQFIWRTENDRVTLSESPGLKFTYLGQGDRGEAGVCSGSLQKASGDLCSQGGCVRTGVSFGPPEPCHSPMGPVQTSGQ